MTEKASKAPNHWPLLDFLRAAAALLVLFWHSRDAYFHYTDALAQPGLLLKLFYFVTGLAGEAVVIFFVLSGFLIGGSLADSLQRGSFDLVRYLIARFVRIYIVYIPALIITEAVFLFGSLLLSDPGAVDNRPLISQQQMHFGRVSEAICHLAGLQGFSCPRWEQNPALWSLGYEWAAVSVGPRDHPTDRVEGFSRSSPDGYCAGLRDRGDGLPGSQAGGGLVHRLVPRRRLI